MERLAAFGVVPLICLALGGCADGGWGYGSYDYDDGGTYEGYEVIYLEAEDSHLYGGLGDVESITGAVTYADAYTDRSRSTQKGPVGWR
jgi:hypothetical protein